MTLTVSGVTHAYDRTPVLEDVSLSIRPGEVTAVIGPSGVGKSTLIRLLALFDPPDDGHVEYDGRDLWQLPEADRLTVRRRIGMVFQEESLFDASVRRNVSYGLRIRTGWGKRLHTELRRLVGRSNGTDEAVEEALRAVGLESKIDADATSLSGGEAQRLAFARALAVEPEMVLLDEPTSDLDPRNTAVIEDTIRAARNRDIGVVVATHDMHQARRIADRVAVLVGGELIEVGDAETIFSSPSDDRTRRFISGELVY